MKYQAIIFDMDGTISDSEPMWDKATDMFLANHNINLHPNEKDELYKNLHGTTHESATSFIKNRFQIPHSLLSLMDEYIAYAEALMRTEVTFIDGFLDFHSTLDNHNLKYGIATNADHATLAAIKEALSLDTLFGEHIYNIDHVNRQGKPKPDIYLYAASKLSISPYACIAIEDSACGIKSAKAAGMFCIGINTHGNPSLLKEADLIIDSYHEIDLAKL